MVHFSSIVLRLWFLCHSVVDWLWCSSVIHSRMHTNGGGWNFWILFSINGRLRNCEWKMMLFHSDLHLHSDLYRIWRSVNTGDELFLYDLISLQHLNLTYTQIFVLCLMCYVQVFVPHFWCCQRNLENENLPSN